jgi:carboxyl-terminal processing protease
MSIRMLGRGLGWILLGGLLGLNLLLGSRLYSAEVGRAGASDAYEKIALFTRVLEQIRANYVDPSKAGYDQLIDGALSGMLQSLDPHCEFMDLESYSAMKDDTSGQFGGLGIVVSLRDGLLTVVAPMEDTPSYRAGMLAGDRIVEIDGQPADRLDLSDAVKALRGAPGTRVVLRVLRGRSDELKSFDLVREKIELRTVKDARLVGDDIGYLRITQFSEPTADLLREEIDRLVEQGLRGLVLDLRNNPGGLLSSAIEVSQLFLERGDEVVSTLGRTGRQDKPYLARGRTHYRFPLAILVNSASASASEIVAGALQDHQRAVLVGEKTFGKGSVQSVVPLDDGTAIRLTTAKYYTPSHRVIHEHGIEPDIVVAMPPEDLRDLMMVRAHPGDWEFTELSDDERERLRAVRDPQLDRAVDLLLGVRAFTRQVEAR